MARLGKSGEFYGSTALSMKASPFSRCARGAAFTAALMLAAHMPAAQAQSAQDLIDHGNNVTSNLADISATINDVEKLNTSKFLRDFKALTGAIGDFAPYLGFLSSILSLATIGQESQLDTIEKKLELSNGKIDELSAKLSTSVKTIIQQVDVDNQRETVAQYRIQLEGARAVLGELSGMHGIPDATKVRAIDRNMFTNASIAASSKCTDRLLEQAAAADSGNVATIAGFGHYMLDTLSDARMLEGAYYAAQTSLNNTRGATKAEIKAKAEEAMGFHDKRIDACWSTLTTVLKKYSEPTRQMDAAIAFIKNDLLRLGTSQSIVDTLKSKYPYHHWIAVKYDGVRGNDNHFAIGGGHMRLLFSEGQRDWNLVLGYYKKGSQFANDSYFVAENCADALGGLETGSISDLAPSAPRTNAWPAGDIGGGWTSFKKWCGNPSVAGFWIARGNTNAEFAVSDRSAESDYPSLYFPPSPKADPRYWNRVVALQFMATKSGGGGSYLIMPQPLVGDDRSIAAQQAASARQAKNAAPAIASGVAAGAATVQGPQIAAIYTAEVDFCHNAISDTTTGNNITVEFISGGRPVGAQVINGSVSDCGTFSKGYLLATTATDKPVDRIRVSTDGGDAMYIDQVQAYRNGQRFIWEGRNNGGGWCLSTDANDYIGGWESVTSGVCARTHEFDDPAS